MHSIVSKYGHLIRQMLFECHLVLNAPANAVASEDGVTSNTEKIAQTRDSEVCVLPDFAIELLDGTYLPTVTSITVKFLPDNNSQGGGWIGGPYMPAYPHELLVDEQ